MGTVPSEEPVAPSAAHQPRVVIQLAGGPLDGRLVELARATIPQEYRVPIRRRMRGPWGGWLYVFSNERTPLGLAIFTYVEGTGADSTGAEAD